MSELLIGNQSVFAIESCISQAYKRLSFISLGFFIIYVNGMKYGVREKHATLLACSLNSVRRRVAERGNHVVSFGAKFEPQEIAEAYAKATYSTTPLEATFLGMSMREFKDEELKARILWAPDGDAAFDDGSHVLQFDCGEMVRLIAFRNDDDITSFRETIREAWLSADEYYGILDEWQRKFTIEWLESPKTEE